MVGLYLRKCSTALRLQTPLPLLIQACLYHYSILSTSSVTLVGLCTEPGIVFIIVVNSRWTVCSQ